MIPKKHIIMPIAVMCVFNVLAANEIQDSLTVNLDEVSVTALKRMSAFRDDPAAATLITSKELDRLGIMSIKGYLMWFLIFLWPTMGRGSRLRSTSEE